MSKTLSQWEIDALLNSIGTEDGGLAATTSQAPGSTDRSIKLYDFRRPDKFSKEHIRAIQNIHETFARVTASSLSSRAASWKRRPRRPLSQRRLGYAPTGAG